MSVRYETDDSTLPDPRDLSAPLGARGVRAEILGTLTVLLGIFVMACLMAGADGRSIVGSAGQHVRKIQLIFGQPVSFLVPLAIVWLGVETFLGRARRWSAMRIFGIFFTIWGITGLLALPGADNAELRDATFNRAGALGTFLVEWEGLRLVGQFGIFGSVLVLTGLVLVGIVMTTNVGLSTIAAAVLRKQATDPREVPAASPRAAIAPRQSLWSRLFPRPADPDKAKIITCPPDDPTGWDDLDEDVAAAARALEFHEWESRRGGLRVGAPARNPRPVPPTEPDDEDEERDEEQDIDTLSDEEEWEEDYADEEEEEEEDDEIIFQDHSAPLPITQGNPANSRVGEGLARLFPSRWPKEGTPASAAEKEEKAKKDAHEEQLAKAEARHLRQVADLDADDDPLFTEEFDTRPYGPSGQPTDEAPEFEAEQADLFDYRLPNIELLTDPPTVDARMTKEEVVELSATLIETLANFGIDGKVTEVHQGPVVTRFEFRPAAGIKVSRIVGLEQDMAMAMRAISVRILAPIPGKNTVGIEVPNKKRQGVYLKELISCPEFWDKASPPLTFALGKTIEGAPHFADLAKMPHLLIAGATGAGKSVCLNTIICSLLYRRTPSEVRMIMVDPKRVELSVYADIPHLLAPVVCEPKCAAAALEWAVEQMEERYKLLVQFGVRNIDSYNRVVTGPDAPRRARGRKHRPMPYIIVVVDELADLMLVAKADVEESIQRLAQMARAVGIHLILATQRPSVNVITGIIKANFPSRIAFQVSQKVDSRTILDCNGAEALLGRGDMLFSKGGAAKPIRIQGAFLSDEEVEHIADYCRSQMPPHYEVEEFEPKLSEKEQRELARMMGGDVSSMDDLDAQGRMIVRGTNRVMGKVSAGLFIPHDGGSARAGDEEIDEALVRAAARLILETRKASVSLLQRRLKVGFARAGRLMDMLEEMGLVGEFKGSKPRDIGVDPDAALAELDKLERALRAGKSVEQIKSAAQAGEDYAADIEDEELDEESGEYEEEEGEYEDEEEYDEEEEEEEGEEDEYDEEDEEYEEEEEEEEEDLGDPNRPWPKGKRG